MPYVVNRRRPSPAPSWCKVGRVVLFALIIALGVRASGDNIFDDNWTPPKRIEKPAATKVVPANPNPTVAPTTPPITKAPPSVTSPPADLPPAEVVPARRAIPAKADQDRSRKLMKEIFAKQLSDRSVPARRKLAEDLLTEADKVTDNPADQFVLLSGAVQAAREAGSAPLCFEAADGMAKAFDVDGLAMRTEAALKMSFAGDSPESAAENVRLGMELLDELVEADDFVLAARLGAVLQRASANNASQRPVVQQRLKEIGDLRLAHERFALQHEKLKTAPDDPFANLAVGGYYAFVKNQWEVGLPFLAKGSNTAIKTAVAAERSAPKTSVQLIAAGDAWWDAAEKESATAPGRGAMRRHAAAFYSTAIEGEGVTGLSRTRLEKRIELAGKAASPAGIAKQQMVLLLASGKAIMEPFKVMSDGRIRIVGDKAEQAAVLADPATYAKFTVIAVGANHWRDMAVTDISEQVQQSLGEFVRNGGDLIFYEQFAMGNMSIVDRIFGIKTNGGPRGATVEDAELRTKLQVAGYNDLMLESINFYNSYDKLPEGSRILLRGGKEKRAITAVVVPFGKGRLILCGTTWDKLEEKVNEAILQICYHYKPSKQ